MCAKVADLDYVHPCDCLIVAGVRGQYADWKWYLDYGYICYRIGSNKLLEHRLVAELAFGSVPAEYHVHHRDGNRLNNTADNLAVLSRSEHAHAHKPPSEFVLITCPVCGRAFEQTRYRVEKRNAQFCSDECCRYSQRKVVDRPSKDELNELLHLVHNWCALGDIYGVSDNAVRKWAKRYGLDLSVCDGRRKNPLPDVRRRPTLPQSVALSAELRGHE